MTKDNIDPLVRYILSSDDYRVTGHENISVHNAGT